MLSARPSNPDVFWQLPEPLYLYKYARNLRRAIFPILGETHAKEISGMGKVQAIESTALFHRTIWNDLITFIRILTFLFQVIRITLFFTFSWPSTMLLKNEHSRFEMTVIDYQFHGLLDSTYDSNWLVIEPFHKSWSASDPCVLTFMIFQLSTGRA